MAESEDRGTNLALIQCILPLPGAGNEGAPISSHKDASRLQN